jgi:hypothetical protein
MEFFIYKEENEESDKIPDNSILELHTGTISFLLILLRGCCGRDDMMVGFTTTCAISVYHH